MLYITDTHTHTYTHLTGLENQQQRVVFQLADDAVQCLDITWVKRLCVLLMYLLVSSIYGICL